MVTVEHFAAKYVKLKLFFCACYLFSSHVVLQKLSRVPEVGVPESSETWKVVPFMNLGVNRALTLLLRLYCQRPEFRVSKICMFPCFPLGWIQSCTVILF